VFNGIFVLIHGILKCSLSELDVALILQAHDNLLQLRIAHRKLSRQSLSNSKQLDFEDECGSAWDRRGRPIVAVGVLRRASKLGLLAHLHAHNSKVPALNYLTYANVYFEFLAPFYRRVKNCSIFETSRVVYQHFLTCYG